MSFLEEDFSGLLNTLPRTCDDKLINKAFLTGSHAYGTPNNESDIDLVLLMDESEGRRLATLAGIEPDKNYGVPVIRFGKLNLIVVTSQTEYDAWFNGTNQLVQEKPVTRERARDLLRAICGQCPFKA